MKGVEAILVLLTVAAAAGPPLLPVESGPWVDKGLLLVCRCNEADLLTVDEREGTDRSESELSSGNGVAKREVKSVDGKPT